MTTNPRQQRALRLAPPAGELPDDRAAIARALLTRYAPSHPEISNEMAAFLGWDLTALAELENNPQYLIGRLTQALSALLAEDTPPLDATATLLIEAIRDAISYQRTRCGRCDTEQACPRCEAGFLKAARYDALYGLLGLVDELPKSSAGLKSVSR